jgi:3-oxoacyl-[acyl-carrier protein] reductase
VSLETDPEKPYDRRALKNPPVHSLVVGGARGLGLTTVTTLARAGHRVSVIDRLPCPEGAPPPATVSFFAADLLSEGPLEAALTGAVDGNGPVDNALFFQRHRGTDDPWEGEIAIGLTATKRIVDWLAVRFGAGTGGSIVMVGSIADHLVAEEQSAGYHAAKAGLLQLARYYAVTLGPRNIRCNTVSPAVVLKEGRAGIPTDPALAALATVIPLRRIPVAAEIARVIAFLCSPDASCVTGQNIVVDAGLSLLAHESLVRTLSREPRSPG